MYIIYKIVWAVEKCRVNLTVMRQPVIVKTIMFVHVPP